MPDRHAETDPRVNRTRSAVLEATRELIGEVGVDRTCIEAISERCGVARSTIYRHWPNRSQLVLDSLNELRLADDPAVTGDPEVDLRATLVHLGHKLRSDWASLVAEVLAAAARDPELAELNRVTIQQKRAVSGKLIEELQARGRLDPAVAAPTLNELSVAPLFYRRFVVGDPMTDDEVNRHFDLLLERFAPR